jgi:hypothetical protein
VFHSKIGDDQTNDIGLLRELSEVNDHQHHNKSVKSIHSEKGNS